MSAESLLELLKEKSNILNGKFQTFQSDIKRITDQMISSETNSNQQSVYHTQINKLCNNYSITINRLEIEYLIKCEQYLQNQKQTQTQPPNTHIKQQTHTQGSINNLPPPTMPTSYTSHTQSNKKPKRPFKCYECNISYTAASSLRRHNRNNHQKKPSDNSDSDSSESSLPLTPPQKHQCNKCNTVLSSLYAFRRHMKDQHSHTPPSAAQPYQCDICLKTFQTERQMIGHKGGAHPMSARHKQRRSRTRMCVTVSDTKMITCTVRCCDEKFETQSLLGQHMFESHSDRIKCTYPQCAKDFKKQRYLQQHIITVHNGKPYKCDKCDKAYQRQSELNAHSLAHEKGSMNTNNRMGMYESGSDGSEERFYCDICDRNFVNAHGLKCHNTTVHKERFECMDCEESFGDKMELNRHRNGVHFRIEPSELYGSAVGKKVRLLGCDENEQMFWGCDGCEEVFDEEEQLKIHREKVHGNNEGNVMEFGNNMPLKRAKRPILKDVNESSDSEMISVGNNEKGNSVNRTKTLFNNRL